MMAELWDLYDENRVPLGRTVERGKQDGCAAYHVVVVVAVKNSRGEFLITLRDKSKEFFGGYWEFTGGSVLAGETSEEAALREAKEETGIDHTNSRRTLIHSFTRIFDDGKLGWHGDFWDLWLFEADFPIEDVVLQKGETADAKWVCGEELMKIDEHGEFFNHSMIKMIKIILGKE